MDTLLGLVQPMYGIMGWSVQQTENALSRQGCGG